VQAQRQACELVQAQRKACELACELALGVGCHLEKVTTTGVGDSGLGASAEPARAQILKRKRGGDGDKS